MVKLNWKMPLITLCLLFSAVIAQFFRLQILQGKHWQEIAQRQHEVFVRDIARRGRFFSNTSLQRGHPPSDVAFVIDVPSFHLYIDPSQLPLRVHDQMSVALSELLHASGECVRAACEKKSRARKLADDVAPERKEAVEKWWSAFSQAHGLAKNALYFVQEEQRVYPFGKLLGQVLHALRKDKNPKTGKPIPTGGLELAFDSVLQGRDGKRLVKRSPRNPLEMGKVVLPVEHGADIYLTINHYLQAIVEDEIAKAVDAAHARGGWAILMDPHTGEIWALAQYPWFDPSHYASYFNDREHLEQTKVKAITDAYEPGSTMKPLTMAIALKANAERKREGKSLLFRLEEKMATKTAHFPGRSKPISDPRLHYWLNFYMAIQKSSNVYVAKIVQRIVDAMGATWYRNALESTFGFGQKTGIELPSESPGLLPRLGKVHPNGKMEWSAATPYSLAFGHNLLVNSMQMVRAYAIIANGGFDVRPKLVRTIRKEGAAEPLLDNRVTRERVRLLEPEIASAVARTMKYVTKPGGSGWRADIPGFSEAGKTGTSEKIVQGSYSRKHHFSTFIGFAPAKDPRFVLFIGIDEPEVKWTPGVGKNHMGGSCAAPAFREIGAKVLEYLGVEPDDADNRDWKTEARALKELYEAWNASY